MLQDKEEVAWEDAMELVCDRHKLPWGPVAAVWLMQLFKLRLLQVLKEGREGTSGSDMVRLSRGTCPSFDDLDSAASEY